ncbi:MAG: phosphatidylglycerophosphatase A [Candidatus Omnitrophica bacterium CG11_big_fil_rev_8_21_14_0_20_45_26]|uniref:Phosphatidylglycerophosphatase A n=1 Tax=Candidatus Abzuiibacterium crystallinum TaxID=1974748 RepID=A0A2H0LS26_9BACT|nr:MAG: phosphatidylglycerophosphatase A [Candidatus Omnitrophica bacterium CG11_big_fil_rev_8_21_14_0_20_45_26]PIW64982.1 MAG: phosphatidylglycerophosphatase A [Candidatus Omnitrophica bacterium CG12_big_fil_rev_8_21_14_0_65_45_16]
MKSWEEIVGTIGGVGFLKKAPGTFGSVAGLLGAYVVFQYLCPLAIWQLLATLALLVIGVHAAKVMTQTAGNDDPAQFVFDEWVGIWVTFIGVTLTGLSLLMGFVLFRLFDIWKPFFIKQVEKLPNGWGVMMDDVLAGLLANLIVRFLLIQVG